MQGSAARSLLASGRKILILCHKCGGDGSRRDEFGCDELWRDEFGSNGLRSD